MGRTIELSLLANETYLTFFSMSNSTSPSLLKLSGLCAETLLMISCMHSSVASTYEPLTSRINGLPFPTKYVQYIEPVPILYIHQYHTQKYSTKKQEYDSRSMSVIDEHGMASPKHRTSISSRPHGCNLQLAPLKVFFTASLMISSTLANKDGVDFMRKR